MKNIIKLAYVVLCTLVVSCSSFLDEKPQSDFMQEGTGTEDQESKYGSLADAQAELQGAYESFKADIFQSENYTIGDVQSDNCYIGGDGVAEQEFDLLKLTSTNYKVELVWSQYYSMAQTVAAGKPFVKVELGGGTFYFRPQNDVVLEAGSRYKYTVKVNATGLTLEGCTIGSWVDGGGESGAAEDLGYSIQNDGSYMVYNADGLLAWNKAAQKDESINCTLTADIDLTGKDWTRIGTWPGYSGVFNGQGHRITGLNISAATTELFGLLNVRGVIKNLQLIDVNLYGSSGSAAGIVDQNNGQIIACSVTGKISAYGRTCGIADLNYGSITACWFDGTLKEYESGAIVRYNYNTITSCYWGGNAGQGVFRNHGGTVDATKVDGATAKWQTAVDGMNPALTGNDYQWALGTDGLPVLQKKQ